MKRILAVLLCLVMLSAGITVSAASSAKDIPVTADVPFPAAVTEMLMDKVFISGTERLTTANVEDIINSCAQEIQNAAGAMAVVPAQIVLKYPALKSCSTVECTSDYIYTTYHNRGVSYEWLYYKDGTMKKTVSYTYEERTSEFKTFRYSVLNNDNQSIEKQRVEIEEYKQSIHMGDFLFGMAVAVFLMMIGVLIVRAIKKA